MSTNVPEVLVDTVLARVPLLRCLICSAVLYGFGAHAGSGGLRATGQTGDRVTVPVTRTPLMISSLTFDGVALAKTTP